MEDELKGNGLMMDGVGDERCLFGVFVSSNK